MPPCFELGQRSSCSFGLDIPVILFKNPWDSMSISRVLSGDSLKQPTPQ